MTPDYIGGSNHWQHCRHSLFLLVALCISDLQRNSCREYYSRSHPHPHHPARRLLVENTIVVLILIVVVIVIIIIEWNSRNPSASTAKSASPSDCDCDAITLSRSFSFVQRNRNNLVCIMIKTGDASSAMVNSLCIRCN